MASAGPVVQPTRLHVAAKLGQTNKIKRYIRAKDDLHSLDERGFTPLYSAVFAGEVGAVKLLLAAGSDPLIRDMHGTAPLDRAADNGDAVIAKILLAAGADMNALCSERGSTPLSQAASSGYTEATRVFIEAGCDLEKRGVGNYQALTNCALAGHVDTMELILVAWANVDAIGSEELTPLQAAVYGGHSAAVKKLIEWRAKLDMQDEDGCSALHVGLQKGGRDEIINTLIEAGANVNVKNDNCEAPLHIATRK